jgi:hypothetical protein
MFPNIKGHVDKTPPWHNPKRPDSSWSLAGCVQVFEIYLGPPEMGRTKPMALLISALRCLDLLLVELVLGQLAFVTTHIHWKALFWTARKEKRFVPCGFQTWSGVC